MLGVFWSHHKTKDDAVEYGVDVGLRIAPGAGEGDLRQYQKKACQMVYSTHP